MKTTSKPRTSFPAGLLTGKFSPILPQSNGKILVLRLDAKQCVLPQRRCCHGEK
jgi:hypothetical protein